MIQKSFTFLEPVFWEFCKERQSGQSEIIPIDKDRVQSTLNMNLEDFYKLFIDPYLRLDDKQLTFVAELQSGVFRYGGYEFRIQSRFDDKALHWTFVNVLKLGLHGIDPFRDYLHGSQFVLPYQQCFLCGQTDKDTQGSFNPTKAEWFCCKEWCIGTGRKGKHSVKGRDGKVKKRCCFAEWTYLKELFKSRIKNRLTGSYKSDDEITKIFQLFCEERYEANKQIINCVRPKKDESYFGFIDLMGRNINRSV